MHKYYFQIEGLECESGIERILPSDGEGALRVILFSRMAWPEDK